MSHMSKMFKHRKVMEEKHICFLSHRDTWTTKPETNHSHSLPLGGAQKHTPRTVLCFEEAEAIRLSSCFLGAFSQEFSLHKTILRLSSSVWWWNGVRFWECIAFMLKKSNNPSMRVRVKHERARALGFAFYVGTGPIKIGSALVIINCLPKFSPLCVHIILEV